MFSAACQGDAKGEVHRLEAKGVRHVLHEETLARCGCSETLRERDEASGAEAVLQRMERDARILRQRTVRGGGPNMNVVPRFGKCACHGPRVVGNASGRGWILARDDMPRLPRAALGDAG